MSPRLHPWILPLVACGALACDGSRGTRPSALVITLDTTIPEALGCYGAAAGLTPNLDRIAAEGILFEHARTVAPLTMPAHASMWSGLYPVRHSVRRNGATALPLEVDTLAERARSAGYQTAAFLAAVVLDAEFGLDQGFDLYDVPESPAAVEEHLDKSRDADQVVNSFLSWFDSRDPERPFLAWAHFFDPHFPYRPPQTFLERAGNDPYLGEVAAMDAEIGRLLVALENEGLLDSTWIVVVGDHGEGLGRIGESTHAAFTYDSTIRVPLLVRPPNGDSGGTRSTDVVSVVDVFSTLAIALDLGAPGDVDGLDLLSPIPADRGVYFESYFGVTSFGWSHLAGWADANGKYIHSSAPEFYDWHADPDEEQNAISETDVEPYRRAMDALVARGVFEPRELQGDYRGLLGQIERLGYAGGVGFHGTEDPHPLAASEGPSPHQRIAAYAAYKQAQKHSVAGNAAEAAGLLERVVRENPNNHKAQFTLGLAWKTLQRWDLAIAAFRAVLPHPGGERIPAELNLAICYQNIGEKDLAIQHFESALRDTIGPPGAMEILIQLLEADGQRDKAQRYRQRLQRGG